MPAAGGRRVGGDRHPPEDAAAAYAEALAESSELTPSTTGDRLNRIQPAPPGRPAAGHRCRQVVGTCGSSADRSGGELFSARGDGIVFPAALIVVIFRHPGGVDAVPGFTDRRLTGRQAADPQWVGWEQLPHDPRRSKTPGQRFRHSLGITIQYVFGSAIVGQAVLGFTLAWMFRSWNNWARRVLELLVVFAWIIPGSVVAYLWRSFLAHETSLRSAGTLNSLLPVNPRWLIDHEMLSLLFNTWRGTAFDAAVRCRTNSLPPSYLETAALPVPDLVQFAPWCPSIKGYILTNLLLIASTFNDFARIC